MEWHWIVVRSLFVEKEICFHKCDMERKAYFLCSICMICVGKHNKKICKRYFWVVVYGIDKVVSLGNITN